MCKLRLMSFLFYYVSGFNTDSCFVINITYNLFNKPTYCWLNYTANQAIRMRGLNTTSVRLQSHSVKISRSNSPNLVDGTRVTICVMRYSQTT